ncbi:MAG: hypothetical protein NTY48_01255 [Candidatus Diapherotrites archaeon]|nr:hypothetical protein [Candidatus Diapherotrites archaeon]
MNNMKNKGFVITVDSFLAAALSLFLVLLAFYYLSQHSFTAWNTIDLLNTVNDEATTLEKTLLFENAINQDSVEGLSSAINYSPEGYCFIVTITNLDSGAKVLDTIKNGCNAKTGSSMVAYKIIGVRNDSTTGIYLAKVEGWIK